MFSLPDAVRRRIHLLPLVASLAGCLFVLVYRGPGWTILRFYVGDVMAVVLVYHFLGLIWRAAILSRATVVAAVALAIELAQWARIVARPASVTAVVLGATFDPWDVAAYAVGLVLAIGLERARAPRSSLPMAGGRAKENPP